MKLRKLFTWALLTCFGLLQPVALAAQEATEEEYTDTLFHDNIDRTADDFVIASICIADPTDWRNDFLGIMGHAFIHLQCPAFGLDYAFSYEAESAEEEMGRFLKGQLHMGMFCMPFDEYLQPFRRWKCAIREYSLHLPPEVKQRLWKVMDDKVKEGKDLELNLAERGCAQTLVQFVEKALEDIPIQYAPWPEEFKLTRHQLIDKYLAKYPWLLIVCSELLISEDMNTLVAPERKILFPTQLAEVWQKATVNGQPLLTYKGMVVEAPELVVEDTLITPTIAALLVFILTALAIVLRQRTQRRSLLMAASTVQYAVLALQCVVGLVLLWLVMVSNLPGTKGAHLLSLYTPLPLLLWHWRRFWARPYAVLLLLWAVCINFIPGIAINSAHLILAAAIVLLMFFEGKRTQSKA